MSLYASTADLAVSRTAVPALAGRGRCSYCDIVNHAVDAVCMLHCWQVFHVGER
jgi:hypothetical protein